MKKKKILHTHSVIWKPPYFLLSSIIPELFLFLLSLLFLLWLLMPEFKDCKIILTQNFAVLVFEKKIVVCDLLSFITQVIPVL